MILLIDNYDSFVHNLARYFRELGCETEVVRNDALSLSDISANSFEAVVLSPGPCTPAEAGICVPLLKALPAGLPVLGVCLGQQAIGEAFGGRLKRVAPMHGIASKIHHEGKGLFEGLPSPFLATRYHSLAVETPLPPVLQFDAMTDDGLVMAVSHRTLPVWGVQFHPEAILTEHGYGILANFLQTSRSSSRSAQC